jgi:hypothetical protein
MDYVMLRMRVTPLCPGISTQSGDGVSDVPPGSNHVRWDLPRLHSRRGVKGEAFWLGCKLRVSETCDNAPGARALPGLRTPGVPGPDHARVHHRCHGDSNQMTGAIDDELAAKILVRLELSLCRMPQD